MNKRFVSMFSGLGLLCAACIWGFAFVIVKDSLDCVPAIYMLAFRFTIASLALALVYAKRLFAFNFSYLKYGAVLGLYLFLAYSFQTVGCVYTTAGKNAFLTAIYVILVPLLGWPLKKRRPESHVFIAALTALAGIGMLVLKGKGGALKVNIGDVLTLICGIFYAVHILFTAHYDQNRDPVLLTVFQFVFAAIFSWIAAPFIDGPFPGGALEDSKIVFSMLYLGIFSTMVAFVLQNVCLKYLQSSLAALFLSTEAIFGVFFSAVLLGENMTGHMIIGCALMFAAIVFAQTGFDFLPRRGLRDRSL
ncbi:DMT family transporter [Treponema parvum]|uniref:DMT family transporter n=1 Tax=Treponema parvum TaxID=138851 RepID=A0A975IDV4_9SPIR|nr:DMT family transporter [Treponema parvum]QTQ13306.1 DMT family transporter [Treponema parvum]